MMWWQWVLLWWAFGMASIAYIKRPARDWVWGDLVSIYIIGSIGPLVGVWLVMIRLIEADFWSKPIFPKEEYHERQRDITTFDSPPAPSSMETDMELDGTAADHQSGGAYSGGGRWFPPIA